MEAVVHQPLRHVVDRDPRVLGDGAEIDDALVRDEAVRTLVEHREMRLELLGEVVRGEDRDFGRVGETAPAHHADVRPRNGQDAGRTPRRRADRADTGGRAGLWAQRVVRQERREV